MKKVASSQVLVWGTLALWRFLSLVVGIQGELDCSFRGDPIPVLKGKMTLQQIVNPEEGTITVEVVYNDIGWVAVGLNPAGRMAGGEVVIAKPDEDPSETNPGKYILNDKSEDAIELMDKQTLLNATFEQTDGLTILRFTKLLIEEAELEYDPTQSVMFIYAAGSSNEFGNHDEMRGRINLALTMCKDTSAESTTQVESCAFQGDPISVMDGWIKFQHMVNLDEGTLKVEVVYDDVGWLSWGVHPEGHMIGGECIVALTADEPSATNPGKYIMYGETLETVVLMDKQTLTDASFEQKDGQTILKYTKLLKEADELEIDPNAPTTFIFAAGLDNVWADHGPYFGRITLTSLATCGGLGYGSIQASNDVDYSNLWVAHGILMGISWAVFLPIAIGCSLLRKLIPVQGLWIKLHMYINVTAFLLITAAFGIAVYIIDQQADKHFEGRHNAVGLAVYILAFVQILAGYFRPPLTRPDADKQPEEKPEEMSKSKPLARRESEELPADRLSESKLLDRRLSTMSTQTDWAEGEEETDEAVEHSFEAESDEVPASSTIAKGKSLARIAFEISHRVVGTGVLGLAWYTCYTGIMEMVQSFGQSYDKTAALWGVVGGVSCTILLLYSHMYAYQTALMTKQEDGS